MKHETSGSASATQRIQEVTQQQRAISSIRQNLQQGEEGFERTNWLEPQSVDSPVIEQLGFQMANLERTALVLSSAADPTRCTKCGEEIPKQRREAVQSEFCVRCAYVEEENQIERSSNLRRRSN